MATFINMTMSSSKGWSNKQLNAAQKYGGVRGKRGVFDIFPTKIDISCTEEELVEIVDAFLLDLLHDGRMSYTKPFDGSVVVCIGGNRVHPTFLYLFVRKSPWICVAPISECIQVGRWEFIKFLEYERNNFELPEIKDEDSEEAE